MATVAIWQREPDGRPLYAYKCRDEEYERLFVISPVFSILVRVQSFMS